MLEAATPTQRQLHLDHLARQQRLHAQAVPVRAPVAIPPAPPVPVDPLAGLDPLDSAIVALLAEGLGPSEAAVRIGTSKWRVAHRSRRRHLYQRVVMLEAARERARQRQEDAAPLSPAQRLLVRVAAAHRVPVAGLMALTRRVAMVVARDEAMWRLRHELGWSLTRIARLFDRHHTTVLQAERRHAARVAGRGE